VCNISLDPFLSLSHSISCLGTQHVHVVLSLMQEPFQSLPVVWFIHEDTLGQHVRSYAELHESMPNVIEDWRVHFNACAYVVFPDSYLPVCTVLTPNVGIVKTNGTKFWSDLFNL
jgi:hypothetical protein